MKRTLLITVLVFGLISSAFALNYTGGIKVGFGTSMLKNSALNYESELREALRCEITLTPVAFRLSNFDIGLYTQFALQGDTAIRSYTKILGYSSLSIGLSTYYCFTNSYQLGLNIGAGYSISKELVTGSAFLEATLVNTYNITRTFSVSLDTGLRYKKERFEFPITFSFSLKPFIREEWYVIYYYSNINFFNIL